MSSGSSTKLQRAWLPSWLPDASPQSLEVSGRTHCWTATCRSPACPSSSSAGYHRVPLSPVPAIYYSQSHFLHRRIGCAWFWSSNPLAVQKKIQPHRRSSSVASSLDPSLRSSHKIFHSPDSRSDSVRTPPFPHERNECPSDFTFSPTLNTKCLPIGIERSLTLQVVTCTLLQLNRTISQWYRMGL